jgi:hypothetical protein
MQGRKADHEGGLRSFIEDQKKLSDEMRFTLIQFDSQNPCEVKLDRVPLADVDTNTIELVPRGGTPLLDAIGKSVAHLRTTLTPQDNVIVTIITDGEENESHEWDKPKVKAVIDELEAANWKFLFLGANFDAFAEGITLGVTRGAAAAYGQSTAGIGAMYRGMSVNTVGTRSAVATRGRLSANAKSGMNFSDAQKAAMNEDAFTTATVTASDGTTYTSGSNNLTFTEQVEAAKIKYRQQQQAETKEQK